MAQARASANFFDEIFVTQIPARKFALDVAFRVTHEHRAAALCVSSVLCSACIVASSIAVAGCRRK
jgi:formate hydrogenlyase subunit 6/NADH:ubiquinone oxidoreductase subunit I